MTGFIFNDKKGILELNLPGFCTRQGILEINTDRSRFTSNELSWKRRKNYWESSSFLFKLKIYVTNQQLKLEVENISRVSYKVSEINLLFPPSSFSPALASSLYLQYVRPLIPIYETGIYLVHGEPVTKENNKSYNVTLFYNTVNSGSLLLGSVGKSGCITSFEALHAAPHKDTNFGLKIKFDFSCMLKVNKKLVSSKLLVLNGNNPISILQQYGRIWKKEIGFKAKPKIIGWNSWDYYAGSISEKDVKGNIEVIKEKYPQVKSIVIDDGWQQRWGEWEPNCRFPSGLKGLVNEIKQAGLVPGIWTAPYTMHVYSPFCRYHQDCLVRDKNGNPVSFNFSGGPVVLLDPTHPLVKEYIVGLFKKLKAAGFAYFKIDFAQYLLEKEAEVFYDKSLSRMAVMRKALQIIRKTVGQESYILSGTFPVEVAAGLLDAVRITGDIHNFWSHIKMNAWQVASGFWMQGNLYNNDPDFLIVRSKTTSRDKYFNYPYQVVPFSERGWKSGREANEQELKVWATLLLLSGGDIVLSDNLTSLNKSGEDIIKKVLLEKISLPAIPLDLFSPSEQPPSIWLGEKDGAKIIGIINWADNIKSFSLDIKKWAPNSKRVIDIWEEKEVSLSSIEKIKILPHRVKLFKFTN